MRLYSVIAFVSAVIRLFGLENPFECFGDKADIINYLAEPIIHILSYNLVGLVYQRGKAPAWGSFLYLMCYAGIVGILALMGRFSFAWWCVLIVIAIVAAVFVLMKWIKNRFFNYCKI